MPIRPKVAIACQGGGSHAAFTAGALEALFSPAHRDRFDLLALSGTSGGAVCAALAWSGLIAGGAGEAVRRLRGFWHDLAASDPLEAWLNAWTQLLLALPVTANASPYAYAPAAEPRLRELLERWVRPEELPAAGAARSRPFLRLGVADVLRGGGAALDGESAAFSLSDVVASCAVPPLFRAVQARGTLWWDGLYSHNPPLRALLELPEKPEEIWLLRINPRRRAAEPRSFEEIDDRRNELGGNVPVDQELDGIALVNRLLAASPVLGDRFGYRQVTVREICLPQEDLPYRSKLDRSVAHLEHLAARGRTAAPELFEPASVVVAPEA
ncbi:patatin-like phospholipase family protein [Falsiroseomonas oryzae]|uniref:patatin-like phospholipase family protein n=1 Tax=Falsiroseomonas oryzae TaxID=2766473 RepID=UPI0022EA51B3|nr:patatin-like phospholipase family protein [Roseomonas sp. MO-31]